MHALRQRILEKYSVEETDYNRFEDVKTEGERFERLAACMDDALNKSTCLKALFPGMRTERGLIEKLKAKYIMNLKALKQDPVDDIYSRCKNAYEELASSNY